MGQVNNNNFIHDVILEHNLYDFYLQYFSNHKNIQGILGSPCNATLFEVLKKLNKKINKDLFGLMTYYSFLQKNLREYFKRAKPSPICNRFKYFILKNIKVFHPNTVKKQTFKRRNFILFLIEIFWHTIWHENRSIPLFIRLFATSQTASSP